MNFLKLGMFSLNFLLVLLLNGSRKRYKISLPKAEDVSLRCVSINICSDCCPSLI